MSCLVSEVICRINREPQDSQDTKNVAYLHWMFQVVIDRDQLFLLPSHPQDTFLPHVECGTVTLIGATTENPSFQVNAALLSRCRVIVLEKLSVEAMEAILMRAVRSLGVRVLGQGEQHSSSATGGSSESLK